MERRKSVVVLGFKPGIISYPIPDTFARSKLVFKVIDGIAGAFANLALYDIVRVFVCK